MDERPSFPLTYLRQFDYLLLLLVLMTTALGLMVLDGSTSGVQGLENYTVRQATWWGVSVAAFFAVLVLPYGWLRVLGWPLYLMSLGSLMLPILFKSHLEVAAGGAVSWLKFSFGSHVIRMQPSEFAKIIVVIALAHWLAVRQGKLRNIWECIVPTLLVAAPMALIFKQPDIGTASVFAPLLVVLLFVAGLDWKVIIGVSIVSIALAAAGVYYIATAESIPGLRSYQQARLKVYMGPLVRPFRPPGVEEVLYSEDAEDEGGQTRHASAAAGPDVEKKSGDDWNIRQAEMALGSGEITGKGWRKGTQSRLKFLPEHYTDFIFPSLGEQFGLMGCVGLIALYLLIIWRAIRISILTSDPFGKYLVIGLLTIFFTHVFLNIGMSIRLLPVTGLPLPLLSYGGSFLLTNYLLFALIANVGMRRRVALMTP